MATATTCIRAHYSSIGRITICELESEQGKAIGIGAASCHPTDCYDETLGRAIAFRRALSDAEHSAARVVRHRSRKVFARG